MVLQEVLQETHCFSFLAIETMMAAKEHNALTAVNAVIHCNHMSQHVLIADVWFDIHIGRKCCVEKVHAASLNFGSLPTAEWFGVYNII